MTQQTQTSPDAAATGAAAVATGTQDVRGTTGEELFDKMDVAPDAAGGAAAAPANDGAAASATTDAGVSSTLTKDDITEILKNAGLSAQPTAAQTQDATATQPQITQEQFNQMFNVWQPSAELVAQLRHEDPQVALKALAQMRDAVIRQALTMAEYRIQQYVDRTTKDFDSRLEPLSSYVTERQAMDFRTEFFEKNPDLAPYEQIVDAVSIKLDPQLKGKSNTREQIMKLYAEETKKVLGPILKAGGAANNDGKGGAATAAVGKGRMSTLTSGGQAGGGRSGDGKEKHGPPGIEVWDE